MDGVQPICLVTSFVDQVPKVVGLVVVDVCAVHQQTVGFHHGNHTVGLIKEVKRGFNLFLFGGRLGVGSRRVVQFS